MAVKIKRSFKSVISEFPSPLRSFLSLFLVLLMLVGVGVGVVILKNSQKMRVGAQGVVLSLLGPADNILPGAGQEFNVDIYVDTQGMAVSAADLKIKYDPNALEGVSMESVGFLPVVLIAGRVDNNNGIASITLGANPDRPVSGSAVVAKLKLKTKTVAPTSILVDESSAVAVIGSEGNVLSQFATLNLLAGSIVTPTPLPTPPLLTTPVPTGANPTPSSTNLVLNEIVKDNFFVVLKGSYLGGEGNRVLVLIKYRYQKTGRLFSKWVRNVYEGNHTVIKEGGKEVIYISSNSLPNFDTNYKNSRYEIRINSVRVSLPSDTSTSRPNRPLLRDIIDF